jgi:hypothetical protein
VFYLRTTKPWQGPYAEQICKRTGPEMLAAYAWSGTEWLTANYPLPDRFSDLQNGVPGDLAPLPALHSQYPLTAERLVLVSVGEFDNRDWGDPLALKSFRIDSTELLRRIAYAADMEPDVITYRESLMSRFAAFKAALAEGLFPPALSDFDNSTAVTYAPEQPYQNIVCGASKALAIYLGENPHAGLVDRVSGLATHALESAGLDQESLVIWFRHNGSLTYVGKGKRPDIGTDARTHTSISAANG